MKGIVLAGGAGTRLYPMTKVISKQLQPIYDKPMIHYPISSLIKSGIKEIIIISTPRDLKLFEELLGGGEEYGVRFFYMSQTEPKGLAQAFIIASDYIDRDDVCMILGDNLFHGDHSFLKEALDNQKNKKNHYGARIFAYEVEDPNRYGVVEFDVTNGSVKSIEEKPRVAKSNYAIPGLYIFDQTASDRAKNLKPSARGELEIVDLIKSYLFEGSLGVSRLSEGMNWFDTGTPASLLEASNVIAAVEKRKGKKVACLHEDAFNSGFIGVKDLRKSIDTLPGSPYRDYVEQLIT